MIPRDKIKVAIDHSMEVIDETLNDWNNIAPEQIPSAYFHLGLYSRNMAIYSLLLEDRDKALAWFKKSSEYHLTSLKGDRARYGTGTWGDEAGVCNVLLNSAVLSGDMVVMEEAARATLAMDDVFPVKHTNNASYFFYVKALGYILVGDDGKAAGIVDMVYAKSYSPFKDFFDGLGKCLQGNMTGDRDMVLAGLILVLKYHDKKYGMKKGTVADELICVPATVQVKLARMKGITIKADDIEEAYRRYIPWILLE